MSNTPPPPPPGFGGPPPPSNFGGPPPPPSFGMNYNEQAGLGPAEWWKRLLAYILDAIILACVSFPLGVASLSRGTGTSASYQLNGTGVLVSIVLGTLYHGLLTALKGQTVGKMALGIKVVKKGTDEKIEMVPALLRAVVMMILLQTCILGILDFLWQLWDSDKQTIHDKVGGSQVVNAR
jgi:uncharacterized RDD family membrane protein YckC